MRVLCTGDLHVGRRPSGPPDAVPPLLADLSTAAPTAIVDRPVDLPALSGEVVDQADPFFDPFRRGIRR